jgi:hypothetical protein
VASEVERIEALAATDTHPGPHSHKASKKPQNHVSFPHGEQHTQPLLLSISHSDQADCAKPHNGCGTHADQDATGTDQHMEWTARMRRQHDDLTAQLESVSAFLARATQNDQHHSQTSNQQSVGSEAPMHHSPGFSGDGSTGSATADSKNLKSATGDSLMASLPHVHATCTWGSAQNRKQLDLRALSSHMLGINVQFISKYCAA